MIIENMFEVLLVLAGLCVFLPAALGHYALAVLSAVVLLMVWGWCTGTILTKVETSRPGTHIDFKPFPLILMGAFLAPILLRRAFDSFLKVRRSWYELCGMMDGSPAQCKLVGMIFLGVLAVLFLVCIIVELRESDHHPAG